MRRTGWIASTAVLPLGVVTLSSTGEPKDLKDLNDKIFKAVDEADLDQPKAYTFKTKRTNPEGETSSEVIYVQLADHYRAEVEGEEEDNKVIFLSGDR